MDSIEESISKMIQTDNVFFSLIYNSVPGHVQEIIEYRYNSNGKIYSTRKDVANDLLYLPAY